MDGWMKARMNRALDLCSSCLESHHFFLRFISPVTYSCVCPHVVGYLFACDVPRGVLE